jgi:glycosyltransferase involved in cell wall biosynthesis
VNPVDDQDATTEHSASPVNLTELTIMMPCLNEAATLGACIDAARSFLSRSGVSGEIVIADNGSTDGSIDIAEAREARVVHADRRGYGEALRAGIAAATGDYVIMGDCDMSYDFEHLDSFVDSFRAGADLVVGNRFLGGIEPGAMPWLHRYIGNPILSFLARRLFRIPVGDFHCGLRGVRRETAGALPFRTGGMEFASEMIIRSAFADLDIVEVATTLRPDGRDRPPHLRRWRDGWRHLRLLLLYSPRWLFLYPGLLAVAVATALSGAAIAASSTESGIRFGMAAIGLWGIGMQSVCFAVLSKVWGARLGLLPGDVRVARFLERFAVGPYLLLSVAWTLFGVTLLIAGFRSHGVDAFDILGIGSIVLSVQFGLNSCLIAVATL